MTTKTFSKSEAVKFGWNVMKSNLGFFIVLLIVVGLIYIVPDMIGKLVEKDAPVLAFIISIISLVLGVVVGLGLIKIALRFCDNQKGRFADLFSQYRLFFKYLFGSILYNLIVSVGMILFIIPGIIWSIQFQFFPYFIVEKRAGPIEALKRSSRLTKGIKWNLFRFNLLLMGINLLGTLCLLIGLFATIPTTMVAMAFVYRKLLAQMEITQVPGVLSKEMKPPQPPTI